mgnify:CR=1 FL=1
MNVRELAETIGRAANNYAASCEVISITRFGEDGSSIKLTVDAGYDGEKHEECLSLNPNDRKVDTAFMDKEEYQVCKNMTQLEYREHKAKQEGAAL